MALPDKDAQMDSTAEHSSRSAGYMCYDHLSPTAWPSKEQNRPLGRRTCSMCQPCSAHLLQIGVALPSKLGIMIVGIWKLRFVPLAPVTGSRFTVPQFKRQKPF